MFIHDVGVEVGAARRAAARAGDREVQELAAGDGIGFLVQHRRGGDTVAGDGHLHLVGHGAAPLQLLPPEVVPVDGILVLVDGLGEQRVLAGVKPHAVARQRAVLADVVVIIPTVALPQADRRRAGRVDLHVDGAFALVHVGDAGYRRRAAVHRELDAVVDAIAGVEVHLGLAAFVAVAVCPDLDFIPVAGLQQRLGNFEHRRLADDAIAVVRVFLRHQQPVVFPVLGIGVEHLEMPPLAAVLIEVLHADGARLGCAAQIEHGVGDDLGIDQPAAGFDADGIARVLRDDVVLSVVGDGADLVEAVAAFAPVVLHPVSAVKSGFTVVFVVLFLPGNDGVIRAGHIGGDAEFLVAVGPVIRFVPFDGLQAVKGEHHIAIAEVFGFLDAEPLGQRAAPLVARAAGFDDQPVILAGGQLRRGDGEGHRPLAVLLAPLGAVVFVAVQAAEEGAEILGPKIRVGDRHVQQVAALGGVVLIEARDRHRGVGHLRFVEIDGVYLDDVGNGVAPFHVLPAVRFFVAIACVDEEHAGVLVGAHGVFAVAVSEVVHELPVVLVEYAHAGGVRREDFQIQELAGREAFDDGVHGVVPGVRAVGGAVDVGLEEDALRALALGHEEVPGRGFAAAEQGVPPRGDFIAVAGLQRVRWDHERMIRIGGRSVVGRAAPDLLPVAVGIHLVDADVPPPAGLVQVGDVEGVIAAVIPFPEDVGPDDAVAPVAGLRADLHGQGIAGNPVIVVSPRFVAFAHVGVDPQRVPVRVQVERTADGVAAPVPVLVDHAAGIQAAQPDALRAGLPGADGQGLMGQHAPIGADAEQEAVVPMGVGRVGDDEVKVLVSFQIALVLRHAADVQPVQSGLHAGGGDDGAGLRLVDAGVDDFIVIARAVYREPQEAVVPVEAGDPDPQRLALGHAAGGQRHLRRGGQFAVAHGFQLDRVAGGRPFQVLEVRVGADLLAGELGVDQPGIRRIVLPPNGPGALPQDLPAVLLVIEVLELISVEDAHRGGVRGEVHPEEVRLADLDALRGGGTAVHRNGHVLAGRGLPVDQPPFDGSGHQALAVDLDGHVIGRPGRKLVGRYVDLSRVVYHKDVALVRVAGLQRVLVGPAVPEAVGHALDIYVIADVPVAVRHLVEADVQPVRVGDFGDRRFELKGRLRPGHRYGFRRRFGRAVRIDRGGGEGDVLGRIEYPGEGAAIALAVGDIVVDVRLDGHAQRAGRVGPDLHGLFHFPGRFRHDELEAGPGRRGSDHVGHAAAAIDDLVIRVQQLHAHVPQPRRDAVGRDQNGRPLPAVVAASHGLHRGPVVVGIAEGDPVIQRDARARQAHLEVSARHRVRRQRVVAVKLQLVVGQRPAAKQRCEQRQGRQPQEGSQNRLFHGQIPLSMDRSSAWRIGNNYLYYHDSIL